MQFQQNQHHKLPTQLKMQIPHPASQYAKYRSQSKTNALLHRLNNDSGYPQDIINSPHPYQSKNYLHLNKQNLKNFFADRIPPPQAKLFTVNSTVDPSRIYQIKKQQYQLRHNAKVALNGTIKITSEQQIHKDRIRKISEIFALNDKNLEFKLKFFDVSKGASALVYPPENYRRGTKSFVDKKKSITKKEAYEKVFGVDLSSTVKARKIQQNKRFFSKTDSAFYKKSVSVPLKMSTLQLREQEKQTISKQRIGQFRRLIGRIKQHNQEFSSNMHQKDLESPQQKESISNRQQNQEDSELLIEWMKNCGKQYQAQYNKNTTVQLKTIDDIQKIDAEFYEKMYLHKKRRLNRRIDFVDKSSIHDLSIINSPKKLKNYKQEDRISMISNVSNEEFQEPKLVKRNTTLFTKKKSTKEKFMRFCDQLKKTLEYSTYYGVAKKNIYSAFWKLSLPFEKEGSYSFFKAIKRGQLDAVKIFIQKDVEYAFEVDDKKRSPLINAIRNNHQHVVQYLLHVGVNVDAQCVARKRPLYYAISNKNWSLVQKLLYYGAQPWSSKSCNYNELERTNQIQCLLKNAKKIHIASRLHKWIQRHSFWLTYRQLILPDKLIDFKEYNR